MPLWGQPQFFSRVKVDIDLGADNSEMVPFSARMNDLAGELFEYLVALDTPEGRIKVSRKPSGGTNVG